MSPARTSLRRTVARSRAAEGRGTRGGDQGTHGRMAAMSRPTRHPGLATDSASRLGGRRPRQVAACRETNPAPRHPGPSEGPDAAGTSDAATRHDAAAVTAAVTGCRRPRQGRRGEALPHPRRRGGPAGPPDLLLGLPGRDGPPAPAAPAARAVGGRRRRWRLRRRGRRSPLAPSQVHGGGGGGRRRRAVEQQAAATPERRGSDAVRVRRS